MDTSVLTASVRRTPSPGPPVESTGVITERRTWAVPEWRRRHRCRDYGRAVSCALNAASGGVSRLAVFCGTIRRCECWVRVLSAALVTSNRSDHFSMLLSVGVRTRWLRVRRLSQPWSSRLAYGLWSAASRPRMLSGRFVNVCRRRLLLRPQCWATESCLVDWRQRPCCLDWSASWRSGAPTSLCGIHASTPRR